jgi:hypothetical protein
MTNFAVTTEEIAHTPQFFQARFDHDGRLLSHLVDPAHTFEVGAILDLHSSASPNEGFPLFSFSSG